MSASGSGSKGGGQAPRFDVRVVSIDHYMARPVPGLDECYSQLAGCAVEQVPVVRIFGATPGGQKACAHVHGAFPYFYVPLEGAVPETPAEADALLRQFAAALEAGQLAGGGVQQQGPPPRRQRVFAVQLVRARKFYGYHADEQLFIKILLYNPSDVSRMATMLQEKHVLGRSFQPHESHIPFLLQFKIDFNLFGMGFMRLGSVRFRGPVPAARADLRAGWQASETVTTHELSPSGEQLLQSSQLSDVCDTVWLSGSVPPQWLPEAAPAARLPPRQSCCELEVDARVEDILNRRQLVRRPLGQAAPEEQLVESLVPMWTEETRRGGGALPPRPPSPPRRPQPDCAAVGDVRAQFQRIADEQGAAAAATPVATPPSGRQPQPREAATPLPHQSPRLPEAATPQPGRSPALVACTPAANAEAHTVPRTAARAGAGPEWSSGPGGAQPPAADTGGDASLWGDGAAAAAPEQAEADAELRELLQWMHESEADGGSQGLDPLLSLAAHAEGEAGPASAPASQAEALHRARSFYATEAQQEVDAILEASQGPAAATPPDQRRLRSAAQLRGLGLPQAGDARTPAATPGGGAPAPGTVRADLAQRFATGVFADSPGASGAWGGLSAEVERALAAAQAVAPPQPGGSQAPDPLEGAGPRIPQTDGCWDAAPGPPSPAAKRPAARPPEPQQQRRQRRRVQPRVPQVDGAGDESGASQQGGRPPGRYPALSLQRSQASAAEASTGRAGSAGAQEPERAAGGSEASSGPAAAHAPFRPPRSARAEPPAAPSARLPVEAARAPPWAGAGGGRAARSRADVRRTHALDAAARALLRGGLRRNAAAGADAAAHAAGARGALRLHPPAVPPPQQQPPLPPPAAGRSRAAASQGHASLATLATLSPPRSSASARRELAPSPMDTESPPHGSGAAAASPAPQRTPCSRPPADTESPAWRSASPGFSFQPAAIPASTYQPIASVSERSRGSSVGQRAARPASPLPPPPPPPPQQQQPSPQQSSDRPAQAPGSAARALGSPLPQPEAGSHSPGRPQQPAAAHSAGSRAAAAQPGLPGASAGSRSATSGGGRQQSTSPLSAPALGQPPEWGGAGGSGGAAPGAGARVLTLRRRPPTQAELDASLEAHGLLPVVAARPHYGDPADLPARPPVFSGLQFRLPTSAVAELKPFPGLRGPRPPAQPPEAGAWALTTAASPPTPAAVRAWLAALRAARGGSSRRTPAKAAARFELPPDIDPNTGMLLPARGGGEGGSQPGSPAMRDSELLGTPSLATPAFEPRSQRPRARSRLAPASQQQAGPQPQAFATPAPGGASGAAGEPEAPVRPASPKYDERTFFYTTPQLRSPQTPWPGSPAAGRAPASAARPPSAPAGLPFPSTGRARTASQISGPSPLGGGKSATPVSQAGFRWRVAGKGQGLTLLSIEVQAETRGRLLSDPRYDAVLCISLAAMDDDEAAAAAAAVRVLLLAEAPPRSHDGLAGVQVEGYASERELLEAFAAAVRGLDPDVLVGWEVQQGSLGYLADRAALLELPLLRAISRTPEVGGDKQRDDEYGRLHASGLHCTGRILLNLWRLLRSEVRLPIHSYEACAAAVLQLRCPHVPAWQLSQWLTGGPAGGRWRALAYWAGRAAGSLAMLEQLDLVGRTGELARAFGVDFFSVLSRGSQYRVESLLARLAHSQNYLLLSPSREQVGRQPAMECIPLVMEPESCMYSDPVVVLDFQSLYPSQIIAYNLCFCTCLGRPRHAADPGERRKLGAASLALPAGTLTGGLAPDKLTISPNGVAWAPPAVRAGVVPRLLQEILKTRVMVKAAMKRHPASAKVLQRVLNARQFGLKLIANVTYGYAAAGFSGRMPMAELADAIVQSGRHTLERTIAMVEAHPRWRARVVYGDTDSLFVLLPGRSRAAAFEIGAEIAAAATAANPPPVTLKMEKVYQPCVLASKKRYVGHMYESPGQAEATFDAKGIETVRRDSCPVVAKMLERTIRMLFTTHDLSQVKRYAERQWAKILAGRVSLADFVFAKEVRLGTYSGRGPAPPAAIVAAKALAADPRAEPRYAERVPYIVVHGPPGARLVDMVVPPRALVEAGGRLRLHATYYITKQILPALERVLHLVGADPRAWFAAMARPTRLLPHKRPPAPLAAAAAASAASPAAAGPAGTIDQYYLSRHCAVCDALTHAAQPLCEACRRNPQLAAAALCARAGRLERHLAALTRACLHCGGGGGRLAPPPGGPVACDSLDCGLYFERRKAAHELAAALAFQEAGLQSLEAAEAE